MEILNVLVVDDEAGIRSGIKRILRNFKVDFPFMDEDFEFNIIEAKDGEIALEIIEQNSPDIVLLDNKLPNKTQGIDILEHIKDKKIDTLVMMITSYASLDLAVKATNFGAYDFIPKPFTPKELRTSMENITKHLFLRRMTREMNKEGKQIRFQFLSVLSHELKAPLNAIEGYLEIIKDKEMGEELCDYDTIIDRSLSRVKGMRNLIMDMLDITRIESGKKKREISNINVVEYAKNAIDTARPYAIQRDIKINLDTDENVEMNADANEIEIIFNNLISNAVKYNKDKGKVDISIKKSETEIVIIVKDTGIGMSEEEQTKLFQDFVRIKNTKTKNIAGTGLGLSILKKITYLYNGDIQVESKPDEGSKFIVKIPVSL